MKTKFLVCCTLFAAGLFSALDLASRIVGTDLFGPSELPWALPLTTLLFFCLTFFLLFGRNRKNLKSMEDAYDILESLSDSEMTQLLRQHAQNALDLAEKHERLCKNTERFLVAEETAVERTRVSELWRKIRDWAESTGRKEVPQTMREAVALKGFPGSSM